MKVVLYARVSTSDKDQDPETQLFALREYCKRMGHEIVEVYSEKAHALNLGQRKQWRALMDRCMRPHSGFQAVVVFRIDRAWRDSLQMRQDLNAWDLSGVTFVSATEDIDTSTAMGRFFLYILGLIAELELASIRERVNAGLDKARSEGRVGGRPPAKHEAMEQAVKAVLNGMSLRKASKQFSIPMSTLNAGVKKDMEA